MIKSEKSLNFQILAGIPKEKIVAFVLTKGPVTSEIYYYFKSKILEISINENQLDSNNNCWGWWHYS
jgi:hypothetical protein